MDKRQIRSWLEAVSTGTMTPEEAFDKFENFPYYDLNFAKVDLHREVRNGAAEVIYCPNKTTEQIIKIFQVLIKTSPNVIATRATPKVFRQLQAVIPEVEYFKMAKIAAVWRNRSQVQGIIGVISAGTADLPVAEEAAVTAEIMGSTVHRIYDVGVAGIHRLLSQREQIEKCRVLIVVAGMEGALASVVGGLVSQPIVAVPTSVGYGTNFKGIAPLLSMLNSCASGIGVVNIDNGFGAGVLAHRINQLGENK